MSTIKIYGRFQWELEKSADREDWVRATIRHTETIQIETLQKGFIDFIHSAGTHYRPLIQLGKKKKKKKQCMQITVFSLNREISRGERVGCDVCKAYLQHERHGRIHGDNDDQCNAPVMGNTHDLRGGRAAGRGNFTTTGTTSLFF